jgi:hypothetical protein
MKFGPTTHSVGTAVAVIAGADVEVASAVGVTVEVDVAVASAVGVMVGAGMTAGWLQLETV